MTTRLSRFHRATRSAGIPAVLPLLLLLLLLPGAVACRPVARPAAPGPAAPVAGAQPAGLGTPERVAAGIDFFRLTDVALVTPPGPIAVQALRLDPRRVDLRVAMAGAAGKPAKATVREMAVQDEAVAAVNAGFFVVATGAPAGLLKRAGVLLSGSARARGAVGILPRSGRRPLRLIFDQVAVERPSPGTRARYRPALGTTDADWRDTRDAVGGAGLLVHRGAECGPGDWKTEALAAGFATARHPRTLIGVDRAGAIWLVTVDGRNPLLSVGMRFDELQALARRLGLREALNLDGGGSTTMVVKGAIVNHPSDASGPRPVSDALLVFPRGP